MKTLLKIAIVVGIVVIAVKLIKVLQNHDLDLDLELSDLDDAEIS